jgi:hypothetical protein
MGAIVKQALTVRTLLHCSDDELDPMNIDTSEIKALSEAMPKDGNIDLNNAEVLATKYLRGADVCAELMAIATAYVQKTDTLKKKAYSKAALENSEGYFASKNNGKKPDKITDKMRTLYADMDDEYVMASQKHDEALSFAKWINGKYDSFNKMHYMCKKILDRGYTHEKMAGFNGTINGEEEQTDIDEEVEDLEPDRKKKKEDFDLGW